ncbi:MAG: thiol protease/hemagglutinin PrtT [Breznakibacter sp.]
MKRIFTVLILCFLATLGYAKLRDVAGAVQVAREFLGALPVLPNKSLNADAPLKLAYTAYSDVSQIPCFYVFNTGDAEGFVIVSADDRATDILGYSFQGSFDYERIPDNFKNWLGFYRDELVYLSALTHLPVVGSSPETQNKSTSAVAPLLGSIMWDQGDPYNALCPDLPGGGKAAVGCVATAMAQVMRYYQWPVQGNGSHQYTTQTHNFSLSANFGATTYDWANTTPTYGSSSTQIEKDAVALLSYHCGVSVDMDFDESSGAQTRNSGVAMINYFGYDQDANFFYRDYFERDAWSQLIRMELDAARPVIYAGQSSDGGHAFVCDGYDANGFFHINWGWSGSSNGFYQLSALTPGVQGIGGGGSDGFNRSQGITVGIQKEDAVANPLYHLVVESAPYAGVVGTTRDGAFTLYVDGLWNLGINVFDQNLGIALFKDGQFVALLKNYTYAAPNVINPYRGYSKFTADNVVVPGSVANGDYLLYFVMQPSPVASWQKLPGYVGTPNYLRVTVTSTEVLFNSSESDYPVFVVDNLAVNPTNLYQNRSGALTCTVTNSGYEYNSVVAFKFVSKSNPADVYTTLQQPFNVVGGETKAIYYSEEITLQPGEYDLFLLFDAKNNSQYPVVLTEVAGFMASVTVLAEPTESPVLSVVGTPAFADNNNVPKIQAKLMATIRNSGGFFDNKMVALVFPDSGGNSLTYFGLGDVLIDKDQERPFSFVGDINLPDGRYLTAVFYYNASELKYKQLSSGVLFTLKDMSTSFEESSVGGLRLYPNPANNFMVVASAETIHSITIYDISGRMLDRLDVNASEVTIQLGDYKPGIYLMGIKTSNGVSVRWFLKK